MGDGNGFSAVGRCVFGCLNRWRLWIRPFVVVSYTAVLLVLVPFLVVDCLENECSRQQRTKVIGGLFALLGLPITLWQIIQHIVHYTKPYLQRHVIRSVVLLMFRICLNPDPDFLTEFGSISVLVQFNFKLYIISESCGWFRYTLWMR